MKTSGYNLSRNRNTATTVFETKGITIYYILLISIVVELYKRKSTSSFFQLLRCCAVALSTSPHTTRMPNFSMKWAIFARWNKNVTR